MALDERNIPPLNRIGDPDDILASVRVENGKVKAHTVLFVWNLQIVTRSPPDPRGDVRGHALLSRLYRPWCHPAHRRACVEAPRSFRNART